MPFISAALRTQNSIDSGEPFKFFLNINDEQQEVVMVKDGHHYIIKSGDKIIRRAKNFSRLWQIFLGGKVINPNTINIHHFKETSTPVSYQLSQGRLAREHVGQPKIARVGDRRRNVGEWTYDHTPESIHQIDSSMKQVIMTAYNDDAYGELAFRSEGGDTTTSMEFIERLNAFNAERTSRYEKARQVIRKKRKAEELKLSIAAKAKLNKRVYGKSNNSIGTISLGSYFKTDPKPFNPKKVKYFMVVRIWDKVVTLAEYGTDKEIKYDYYDVLSPMISKRLLIPCDPPPIMPGTKHTMLTVASTGDIFKWTGGTKSYEIIGITEKDVILYRPHGTSMMPKAMATGDLLKGFERGYMMKI